MNEHVGGRQLVLELMMIGDDQLQPQPACLFGFCQAADAAVHCNHYRCTRPGNFTECITIQAITFLEPVGHVKIGLAAEQVEYLPEDGRPRGAVHIVIAVNANPLSLANRCHEAIRRLGYARQHFGRVQTFHGGVKETAGVLRFVDAAIQE